MHLYNVVPLKVIAMTKFYFLCCNTYYFSLSKGNKLFLIVFQMSFQQIHASRILADQTVSVKISTVKPYAHVFLDIEAHRLHVDQNVSQVPIVPSTKHAIIKNVLTHV